MDRRKERNIIVWAIVISSIAVVLMLARCSAIDRENKIEMIKSEENNEIETEEAVRIFESVAIKEGEKEVLSYEITGYENSRKYIKINCLTEENSYLKAYQGGIELLRTGEKIENIDEKVEKSFEFELRNTEDKIDLVFEELDRKTLKIVETSRISLNIKE